MPKQYDFVAIKAGTAALVACMRVHAAVAIISLCLMGFQAFLSVKGELCRYVTSPRWRRRWTCG